MRSAIECAPKTCQCGKRLAKPHYHKRELCFEKGTRYMKRYCKHCDEPVKERDDIWATNCPHCKRFYEWGWHDKSNGCWRITSQLPLFNTREIVVIA